MACRDESGKLRTQLFLPHLLSDSALVYTTPNFAFIRFLVSVPTGFFSKLRVPGNEGIFSSAVSTFEKSYST